MPDDPSIRDRAKAAQTAADWPEAANCWQQLYRSDAGDREALLGLVCACQAQGLYRDAEALFDGAAADHAGHLDHAIAYAQNAQMRSDLEAALTRSRAIVERFPEHPYGYATLATLLAAAGRQEEGFDMLSRGARRFPDEPSLILPSIHVAVARQDWKRAASGLQRLGEMHPEEHPARVEAARFKPAVAAGHAPTLRNAAADAERDRDFAAGLQAWETLRSLTGETRDVLLGIGRCRRGLGDSEAADTALRQAARDYPDDAEIEANIAEIPAASGDWPEAARRWRTVLRRFPDITAFASMAGEAFARTGARDEAEAVLDRAIERDPSSADLRTMRAIIAEVAPGPDQVPVPPGPDERDAMPMKELVRQFESLGDNCEFGVVQRHFGAEPITLFRFAAIDPERMIELLDLDLEPLGDPAHTHVAEMLDEYYIKDDRGYYYMHTFVKVKQTDAERYIKQQVPRIAYLKRNFLSDVRTGEKVYVCKLSTAQITDDTLKRLSKSLRRYGNNVLLGGRRADAEHAAGSVERLDEHIFVGYTTQLHGEADRPENSKSWGEVLRQVYRETSGAGLAPTASARVG